MSTYDHQKVLTDWSNSTLTADMAIGHALQHIDELYARQKAWQAKVNHLENTIKSMQLQLDRLVKGVSQELEKRKSPTPNSKVADTL